MIQFVLIAVVLCLSTSGLGALYIKLINPDELLSFMQIPLNYFKTRNEFMYKSLGGCSLCARQRITDVSFVLLTILHPALFHWHFALNFIAYFVLYCLYGGLAYYFDLFITVSHSNDEFKIESENINMP